MEKEFYYNAIQFIASKHSNGIFVSIMGKKGILNYSYISSWVKEKERISSFGFL